MQVEIGDDEYDSPYIMYTSKPACIHTLHVLDEYYKGLILLNSETQIQFEEKTLLSLGHMYRKYDAQIWLMRSNF